MSGKARRTLKNRLAKEHRRQRRTKRRLVALRTGRITSMVGVGRRLKTRAWMFRIGRKVMSAPVPEARPAATRRPERNREKPQGNVWSRTVKRAQAWIRGDR